MKDINKFISENFYNINEYLVSGSYLSSKDYNEFSDIDIIIFSHSHINAQNHTIIIGTKKVQIIVVPMINLSEAFFNDYYSLKGSFTHMIANSSIEIINNKGNYKMLENIQNHARKLIQNKLPYHNEKNIYQLKYITTNLLFDIKGNKNKDEILFCVLDVFNYLSSLKMHINNIPSGGAGKHRYRLLKQYFPKFLSKIENSLETYFTSNDISKITTLIEDELALYGGILPYYSKSNILYQVHEDKITLSINRSVFSNKYTQIICFIQNIKDCYFNIFLHDINNVYIQISYPKDLINTYIIPILEKFCIENNISINFPIREDTESHLYHIIDPILFTSVINSIQENIIHLIGEYSKYEDKSIEIAYNLLHSIKESFTEEEYLAFIEYLYSEFLPYYYDDGYINSMNKLIKKIDSTTHIFNNQLLNNIDKFRELFNRHPSYFNNIEKEFIILKNNHINNSYLSKTLVNGKTYWFLYKHLIYRIFSTIFIHNSNKPFIIYTFLKLYNQKNA